MTSSQFMALATDTERMTWWNITATEANADKLAIAAEASTSTTTAGANLRYAIAKATTDFVAYVEEQIRDWRSNRPMLAFLLAAAETYPSYPE